MVLSYFFDLHSIPDLRQSERVDRLSLNKIWDELNRLTIKGDAGKISALSGIILLWHDYWNEAHEIAQQNEGNSDCDLVHALVHRREGDLANTQYWLMQAGNHSAFPFIAETMAVEKATYEKANDFLRNGTWDARSFAREAISNFKDSQLKSIQAQEFLTLAQLWWPEPIQV
jgi:hypothetical protein